jgi:hypothetical protein
MRHFVAKEWLHHRVSVEEPDSLDKAVLAPLNLRAEEWAAFQAQMIDRDELWYFTSPVKTSSRLPGKAGVALVRQGKPIDGIIIFES